MKNRPCKGGIVGSIMLGESLSAGFDITPACADTGVDGADSRLFVAITRSF